VPNLVAMGPKLLSAGLKMFFLGGFFLWTVVPVALVISNSFKTQLDIFSVPPTVYQALLSAPSKGRYFNQMIRGRYRYRPIANFDTVPQSAEIPAKCHR